MDPNLKGRQRGSNIIVLFLQFVKENEGVHDGIKVSCYIATFESDFHVSTFLSYSEVIPFPSLFKAYGSFEPHNVTFDV